MIQCSIYGCEVEHFERLHMRIPMVVGSEHIVYHHMSVPLCREHADAVRAVRYDPNARLRETGYDEQKRAESGSAPVGDSWARRSR